jgi:hypothetical protein
MKNQTKSRRNFLSKMLITGVSGVTLLSSSAFARGKGKNRKSAVTLTEEQLDELYFIYQEEKLARDVYITLGEMYPAENTFASIQLSEQRHIDSARGLCEKYKIDISEIDEDSVGNFEIDILQQYYDQLVAKGSNSLKAAIECGVYVEELDINDLTHIIEDLGMPSDVNNVYENLREGSYNHLEAFQGALTRV